MADSDNSDQTGIPPEWQDAYKNFDNRKVIAILTGLASVCPDRREMELHLMSAIVAIGTQHEDSLFHELANKFEQHAMMLEEANRYPH